MLKSVPNGCCHLLANLTGVFALLRIEVVHRNRVAAGLAFQQKLKAGGRP